MTASRALLRDLQAAFWDVPERKTKKAVVMPAAQLEHHEPAPKLEAAVVPVEPAAKALTNVRACNRARVADPDGPKPLTNNAEHQARWRAAHREESRRQARERMKVLRARRAAAGK